MPGARATAPRTPRSTGPHRPRGGTPTASAILRSLFPACLPAGKDGDPGVIGADGPVWRIAREKAILAGGPAALLLQVAHPLVAAGVVNHSDFESDPLGRLRHTLDSLLTVVFGDRAQAETAVAVVAAVHRPVRGVSGTGAAYRADDPELALWVW
ncbi:MAG TPA: oxygenase MpaB family protein, partial [Acidimicrobiales bacterium]|nr:oxygenase MpaB family protein [Acidimicrobiales bacterium]